jgi:hypothetical protein
MAKPHFKRGDLREIKLKNGLKTSGFHWQMFRRWEKIQFILPDERIFYAHYSRATGMINPAESSILAIDPGYYQSLLIDVK